MASPLTHPAYRPDIDGLRAIAILLVVGYHAFPGWFPGGFIGVDVFFVISGYLISLIIMKNLEAGSFSFGEFYARRIRRIAPAFLLVAFCTLVFGWFILFPDEFERLGKHMVGGAGFFSNILLWSESGYFDADSAGKPLLHLWSLGVEEQFYIVWPVFLGAMWVRRASFLWVAAGVAAVSFAINIFWIDRSPVASFYLPASRFWELMIGGMLAYLTLHRSLLLQWLGGWRTLVSAAGVGLLLFGLGGISSDQPFPGWWGLVPTLGAALVIAAGMDSWLNRNLFGNRGLVYLGLISYPLYLWHWPLFSYAYLIADGVPDRNQRVLLVAASIFLAWITYEWLEKGFRGREGMDGVAVLSAGLIVLGLAGASVVLMQLAPRNNSAFIAGVVESTREWAFPDGLTVEKAGQVSYYVKEAGPRRTLFLGDSHIQQYAPRIVHVLNGNPSLNTAVFITAGGCPPIMGIDDTYFRKCPEIGRAGLEYARRAEVDTVVLGASWSSYFIESASQQGAQFHYYQDLSGEQHRLNGGTGSELAWREFEAMLVELSKRKRVLLVLGSPQGPSYDPKSYLSGSRIAGFSELKPMAPEMRNGFPQSQRELNEKMRAMADRVGVGVIDPVAHLCNAEGCLFTDDKAAPVYMDQSHLRSTFVANGLELLDVALAPPRRATL